MKFRKISCVVFLTIRFLMQPEMGGIGSFISIDIEQKAPQKLSTGGVKIFYMEF